MKLDREFKIPSVTTKSDKSQRLVGFELEFSGLSLDKTVDTLINTLGGRKPEGTAAEQKVHVPSLGDFNIELDWDFLKKTAADSDNEEWIANLSNAAALLVPLEVVCPPVAITGMSVLDPLVKALRDAGAVGTEESLVAAYGVHINPEIPELDSATMFSYLRAFSLLQWWLVEAHEIDSTRKISPYIDLYSETFIKEILSLKEPTMGELMTSYLTHNASRNRALDLLPLFAMVDEEKIRQEVDDQKIKGRPTFHYRLPDCNIEQDGWSLSLAWNKWWVVEELAQKAAALDELSAAFLDAERWILGVNRNKWVEFIEQWLKNHELV